MTFGRRRVSARLALVLVLVTCAGCAREAVPSPLDTANAQCRFCRMAASDVHFAAQIAAPGAEPVFFDDIGCLRDFLAPKDTDPRSDLPDGAVAFVADHRSGVWVRAADAVFTRPKDLNTPMGGGVIAHADRISRDQDPAATGGVALTLAAVFGASTPPNGGSK